MRRLQDARLRRWMIQWALSSLLFVQMLGLLHGIEHRPQANGAVAAQQVGETFGHPASSVECRLFDQVTHTDLAEGDTLPAFVRELAPQPPIAHAHDAHSPAFERHYGARGPPMTA
ncbi:MAG: hypothetical protein ABW190_10925 [Rhizobacter sp.]